MERTRINLLRLPGCCLVILGLQLTLAQTARAELLLRETFSYPSGNLPGNNGGFSAGGGTAWSGPWTASSGVPANAFQVAGGNHVETAGNDSDGYYTHHRFFNENRGLSTYYFGFDYKIHGTPEAVPFFAGAGLDILTTITPSSSTPDAWIYTSPVPYPGGPVKFRALIAGSGSSPGTTLVQSDTLYRIVGRIDYGAGTGDDKLTVWISPDAIGMSETNTPEIIVMNSGLADAGATLGNSRAFVYREDVDSTLIHLGDLRVATDFSSAVPEPTAAALIGLSLAGLFRIRRR